MYRQTRFIEQRVDSAAASPAGFPIDVQRHSAIVIIAAQTAATTMGKSQRHAGCNQIVPEISLRHLLKQG
jgi:hypothetical protein